MKNKTVVPQGTLALMVLKTIEIPGPLHGYAIAKRIEQISGDLLTVNQGTLYPVLLKLERETSATRPRTRNTSSFKSSSYLDAKPICNQFAKARRGYLADEPNT
jgi:PadR family transcriptional regulator